MGSLPPGCGDDTYTKIYVAVVAGADPQTTMCLIDSVAGLDPLFRSIAAAAAASGGGGGGGPGGTVLKIHASELRWYVGLESSSSLSTSSETAGVPGEHVVVEAVTALLQQPHVTADVNRTVTASLR